MEVKGVIARFARWGVKGVKGVPESVVCSLLSVVIFDFCKHFFLVFPEYPRSHTRAPPRRPREVRQAFGPTLSHFPPSCGSAKVRKRHKKKVLYKTYIRPLQIESQGVKNNNPTPRFALPLPSNGRGVWTTVALRPSKGRSGRRPIFKLYTFNFQLYSGGFLFSCPSPLNAPLFEY